MKTLLTISILSIAMNSQAAVLNCQTTDPDTDPNYNQSVTQCTQINDNGSTTSESCFYNADGTQTCNIVNNN